MNDERDILDLFDVDAPPRWVRCAERVHVLLLAVFVMLMALGGCTEEAVAGATASRPSPVANGSVVTGSMLDAVAAIESGFDSQARGARGERGAWQHRAGAWADVNRALGWSHPFTQATNAALARTYAGHYLRLLEARLAARLHRAPSLGEVYAAYNLGFAGFERRRFVLGRCPARTRDAVQRLDNLNTLYLTTH